MPGGNKRNRQLLEAVDIYGDLSEKEIALVAGELREEPLEKGSWLFRQGDPGEKLYIVESGHVSIQVALAGGELMTLADFKRGSFFGEMSIIDGEPRSAGCRAEEKSMLLSLHRDAFFAVKREAPEVAYKIMRRMLLDTKQRLTHTNAFVSDLVQWGEEASRRTVTDELTGLFNRRYLDDFLSTLFESSRTENTSFSLVMVDLDHFSSINDTYSQSVGDTVIQAVAKVFADSLREGDIAARYGGDEFNIVFPNTHTETALDICRMICEKVAALDVLKEAPGPITQVTTSQGIATFPQDATGIGALREAADAALYAAKENGRNRVEYASASKEHTVAKHAIDSIRRKNTITSNIIQRLTDGETFLMLGHENPDEDCIGAMVSFALLVSKFDKEAIIYITGTLHEQHQYLLDICNHNAIRILRSADDEVPPIDTIVACDTPKPTMIAAPTAVVPLLSDPSVIKIEFDHHLAADSAYIGDPDYALVTEASSACELVGYLALKLCNRDELLVRYHIADLFSRNFVLSVLTGIIGDSKMGQFLKSRREQRFYEIFSGMFNRLLTAKTVNRNNFSNKNEVFSELMRFSEGEKKCYDSMMERAHISPAIGYVALDEETSRELFEQYDGETIVSVARAVADSLAEKSSRLGMTAYYDYGGKDSLVQFRIRRSHSFKNYDVRTIIDLFSIANGGGHEGAIGFRFQRNEIDDMEQFAQHLVTGIEEDLKKEGLADS